MRARLLVCAAAAGAAALPLAALPAPVAAAPKGKAIALSPLGTYASGVFGASAAEITAHDPATQRLFVVNAQAGQVDVLDVSDPAAPVKVSTLSAAGLTDVNGTPLDAGSSINSVDVRGGLLAVAVQAGTKTDLGWAALYRTADLAPLGAVRVGAQPDMVVFADDDTVLVANEAEPSGDRVPVTTPPSPPTYASDPEGSVSIIDLTAGLAQGSVRTARFTDYEDGGAKQRPAAVRVFGPDVAVPLGQPSAGRVARNLEPEYIAVDQQGKTAYVTLQEANTVAVLDIRAGEFTDLWPMGAKDWNGVGNVLDASDRDNAVNIRNWPVKGLPMPDAVSAYQVQGRTYVVTANEGDEREFGSYKEGRRLGSGLCADFPGRAALIAPGQLGRLNVTTANGFTSAGCASEVFAFGARSFSILDETGRQVFDSGALLETTVAAMVTSGDLPASAFNANHELSPSPDSRSDDKGVEPEGVDIGKVGGRTYAFVGLERIGGVMTFDITDPTDVAFVDYVNNRNFAATYDLGSSNPAVRAGVVDAKDLGAEGVEFIAAEESPTGVPLVAVANEVSGTTTLFRVDSLPRR